MDWTSLYFKTSNLNVFILGTGEVASRRANKFLDHGANVKLAGNSLSDDLKDKGADLYSIDDVDELVDWSDLVVVASGDEELSEHVSEIAQDKLVNRADFPLKGDIIVPTSFEIASALSLMFNISSRFSFNAIWHLLNHDEYTCSLNFFMNNTLFILFPCIRLFLYLF